MAKKNKEPKAPKTPKPITPFNAELKSGLIIALVLIVVFTSGNILGGLTSGKKPDTQEITTVVAPETTAATTAAPITEATTAAPAAEATTVAPADTTATPVDTTAAPADTTAAPADTTAAPADTTAAPSGAPQSTAEILALFNEAANKIKTEASSITRNYEDLQHNEEKLEVPGPLQSIGKGLISQFLKKDETPVTYTGQQIIDEFPIKGEQVSSKLTEADLTNAQCVDNGDSYKVTLNIITATDPTNTGAANIFTIMKADEIYEAASVVKNFSAEYYDGVVECTIDKATNRITWINYTNPIVLSVTASVVVTLDAKVGMTFIDDYSIAY